MKHSITCAVVGGAGGALGRVVVRKLLDTGLRVHAIYRDDPNVATTPDLIPHRCDLSSGADVSDLITHIAAGEGHIPALINVAGGFIWGKTASFSDQDFNFLLDANFKSVFFLLKNVLPLMQKNNFGRIVLISSAAALTPGDIGMGVYNASKSALNALLKSTANENSQHNIKINAICPTIIDTPRNRKDMPDADFSSWVTPHTVTRLIQLLLTDDGELFSGTLITPAALPELESTAKIS